MFVSNGNNRYYPLNWIKYGIVTSTWVYPVSSKLPHHCHWAQRCRSRCRSCHWRSAPQARWLPRQITLLPSVRHGPCRPTNGPPSVALTSARTWEISGGSMGGDSWDLFQFINSSCIKIHRVYGRIVGTC